MNKPFVPKFKLNIQHFATPVAPGETTLKEKHLGIVEKITAANSYSTPAVISNDAIVMNGRAFTVMKGDTTTLKDYDREAANPIDNVKISEKQYVLEEEKYWARYVDALDKRDTEGNIDIEYVIARQAAEVVAPYLDELRFGAMLRNHNTHITVGSTDDKEYEAVLDVSAALDEAGAPEGKRVLFVTPAFYKGIKKFVIALPHGDANKQVLGKGVQGELDGFIIVKVPSSKLKAKGAAEGVQALATIGEVVASPLQVDDTQIIEKQAGRFGQTAQQLLYTGAFVLEHLQDKIFTIGGTEPTKNPDGEDVHAVEEPVTPEGTEGTPEEA